MGTTELHSAPPELDISDHGRDPEDCPECGHDWKEKLNVLDRLANVVRVRMGKPAKVQKKPYCYWEPAAMTDYCGCKNDFHA